MRLAGIQSGLGNPEAARATLEKAIKAAPRFAPAFIQLGNSYLTIEPRDVKKGAVYIRQALNIEPNAPYTHDFMGDAYRANNELVNAGAEYTRQAELDPTHVGAFQQRGHVNSFLGKYAEARADYDKSISLGDENEKATYPVYRALVNVYAGDYKAAEQELEALVTTIDGMDFSGKVGAKIFALTTELSIALHNGQIDVAQRTADQLGKIWREDAEVGGTPAYRRAQEANIIYFDGMIAARKGDYAGARAKAQEYTKLVEPDKNPRKAESAHEILGMADLLEKKYASASAHLAQGDPNSTYNTFQRAVALEGAGKTAEAQVLFKRVASTNFNSVDVALTKKDATAKAK
jgi:tetratricopeptide (TPR) repeat protein